MVRFTTNTRSKTTTTALVSMVTVAMIAMMMGISSVTAFQQTSLIGSSSWLHKTSNPTTPTSTSSSTINISSRRTSTVVVFMNKKSRRDRDRSTPKGFGAAIRQLQMDSFPYAGSIRPGKQSPQRVVMEEGVVKPDYWQDGMVRIRLRDECVPLGQCMRRPVPCTHIHSIYLVFVAHGLFCSPSLTYFSLSICLCISLARSLSVGTIAY